MHLYSRLRRVGGRAGTTVPRGAVCEPPNPPESLDAPHSPTSGTDPALSFRGHTVSNCILSTYNARYEKGDGEG